MTSLLERKHQDYPEGFTRYIQTLDPISYWQPGKFWLITDYALAKAALADPALSCDRTPFFVSRMPDLDLKLIPNFLKVVSGMMVMADDDDHRAKRRICYQGFMQNTLSGLENVIKETVDAHLDALERRCDFVEDLARPLPCITLAELFQIPDVLRPKLYEWSNTMTQFFGGASRYQNEDGIKVDEAAAALHGLFSELMESRRKAPGDDFLSTLIRFQSHFGLDEEALIAQAIMMLVAGQVTTTDQAAHNLYAFMEAEIDIAHLAKSPSRLLAAIEEATRLDPAVTFLFRVARADTHLGNQAIRAGDTVFISTHACNRDEAFFPEPNRFQLTRGTPKHLSYGFAAHFCLGAKLARLEMQILFERLFTRYPKLTITKAKRRHDSLAFSDFESLQITL